ncbi:MAG: 1,2-phenylacetyl-CoA epoxidase, subunit A, partial [uncultured Nocardioides sp.]
DGHRQRCDQRSGRGGTRARLPGDHLPQRPDRAARLDARGLPEDAGAPGRPARPQRDHRHAARGQLDRPRAQPAPQGDPARQGAGRGRPRPLPLLRLRDARRLPPAAHGDADLRQAEVLLDLQLPDAQLRRRRHDRLAGRRGGDLQPGPAVPDVVRPLRPLDDPHLQGGVLPPAPGLRAADDDDARHRRAARDGAGVGGPVLVAGADDVRPAGQRLTQHRAVDGVGHQAQHQRRAAPEVRGHVDAAGRGARRDVPRPGAEVERRARPLRLRAARLGRVHAGGQGQRSLQRPAHRAPAARPRGRRLGPRGGHGVRRSGSAGRGGRAAAVTRPGSGL